MGKGERVLHFLLIQFGRYVLILKLALVIFRLKLYFCLIKMVYMYLI